MGMDAKSIASGLAPPSAGNIPFFFLILISNNAKENILTVLGQAIDSNEGIQTVLLFFKVCVWKFALLIDSTVIFQHLIQFVLFTTFSGTLPFDLCRRYVEDIVLINDEEIKAAVSNLYKSGLVVEPSGSAAFAAIIGNKIPDLEGKKVVCILSGGNIGKDELANFPD